MCTITQKKKKMDVKTVGSFYYENFVSTSRNNNKLSKLRKPQSSTLVCQIPCNQYRKTSITYLKLMIHKRILSIQIKFNKILNIVWFILLHMLPSFSHIPNGCRVQQKYTYKSIWNEQLVHQEKEKQLQNIFEFRIQLHF